MKFTGFLSVFDSNSLSWEKHIPIPDAIFTKMLKFAPDKRVVCTLNNSLSYHCAMMPKGTFHYILVNNETCKKLKLQVNDKVEVEIIKDDSKYGMNISEELEEVLFSDPEGSLLFHQLTLGKQRSLIHIINKIKSSQTKIEKSFVVLEHLKRQKGELDFKKLNEDFKEFAQKNSI
ncbi:DUF1905 domain-containing protein [Flavobacterium sp.]|uniref:DUF1905 domain-containing protein n=1 Tax=Flavobacterium sp. TaxID=239 RepID=UPI002B4ADB0D|nr:DUF1905 domain-containing protein [Flavobacterium sp.]HLP63305.1 DUF1905 domain-containing protein [Flavobacterium sp.]